MVVAHHVSAFSALKGPCATYMTKYGIPCVTDLVLFHIVCHLHGQITPWLALSTPQCVTSSTPEVNMIHHG